MENQPYRPDGIDRTILGVTFDEFKAYTDEQVAALRERVLEEAQKAREQDEDSLEGMSNAIALSDFRSWRKFGVPDREVTEWDVAQFMTSHIQAKLAADPDYGNLPTEYVEEYTDEQRQLVNGLSQYFAEMREPFEYLTLDDYSLGTTLGFSDEQIDWLTSEGILLPSETISFFGRRYTLSNAYTDALNVAVHLHFTDDE